MKSNFCFDGATPIIYKTSKDGEIIIESIEHAFRKHENEDIYVCGHTFDETEHTSKMSWVSAKLCHTLAVKQICVYLTPTELISDLESDNIIRVTPNHVFPILTKDGYKDVEAYLLQRGDKLIAELNRIQSVDEEADVDENGEPKLEWILEDGSSHYIEYRNVSKVVEEDVNDSSAFGVNFYGVVINEPCESKYFMLCNSVISHDSSVDY